MGISFKVAKTGTRFRPKHPQVEIPVDDVVENSRDSSRVLSPNESSATKRKLETNASDVGDDAGGFSVSSTCSGGCLTTPDHEVSFTLNLFPDGFSIGTAEKGKLQPVLQDIPKSLHPYDRKSETLFSAIESGLLPGDILDDIPGKYFDGTIVCEVQDYRKCVSEPGSCSLDGRPITNKVHLRMSLENVVKDIPSISDDSWTYSDLMEVESRIVKALQPQLCLDPTPMMDRLSSTNKLNLGIFAGWKKRLRHTAEVTVTSNSQAYGKKVSIDKAPENPNCKPGDLGLTFSGDASVQHTRENLNSQYSVSSSMPALQPKNFGQHGSRPALPSPSQSRFQAGVAFPRMSRDRGSGSPANTLTVNANCSSTAGADLINSYADTMNCSVSFQGKRENPDAQLSPMSSIKRPKQTPLGPDISIQQQQVGQSLDSLQGMDMLSKNPLLQQQCEARSLQYASTGGQKYPQQFINDPRQSVIGGSQNQDAGVSFYLEQQGVRHGVKVEQFEMENPDKQEVEKNKDNPHMFVTETAQLDQHHLQRQQQFMSPHFPPQMQWQNLGDPRKDETLQKRKSAQSPRVSSGAVAQSPLPSKPGEISNGSIGAHIGTVAAASTLGPQKEKATGVSTAAVGTPSVASSPSDSMQRQHQATMAAKRRSNSQPKTPAVSGVGSPASVSNMTVPLNANSPSVGTTSLADHADRFSKIKELTQRYQLNCKKNKVDNHPVRKPMSHSTQQIAVHLANSLNLEDLKDAITTMPMSKSLVGGSMNACKSRVLNFIHMERIYQGNGVIGPKFRNKLVLLERHNDGTVAMQYGDTDDVNFAIIQEYGLTLPNTQYADLLAAQFWSLMIREGYQDPDDQIRPMPTSTSLCTTPSVSDSMVTELQFSEAVGGQPAPVQPSGVVTAGNCSSMSVNPSQNLLPGSRMLPPGNTQALQMSQGYLPGVAMPARPQLDQASLQQQNQSSQIQQQQQQQQPQQQHQQSQIQRSSLFHPSNHLSHLNPIGQNSNLQMGNHMINKPSLQQLQMLQQQPQSPQQQPQRKVMAAMAMGNMGNMNNNMVGLGGLGNVVGMGGVRGMGPSMTAPMGPMSGLGNMNQNQINPSQMTNISNMINQQLRSGALSPQAAFLATKFGRMVQNRGMGGQQSITGMPGNNHMHVGAAGLSMLGQTLNRANANSLQRTTMPPMGPPKAQGTNIYMNQQQQQLQFQQLQQQQQQQMQMQPQQQQLGSPLQHQQSIVSQPQACSPSAMSIQQQLGSPSQTNLQTPMSPQQLNSGVLQQMTAGNPAGGPPASPQLSNQTLGSVNSITSSPMELQGVSNKANSINNNNV